MTKNKRYTKFAPKFIFYSVYLSEKIVYWRYIKIFRHLDASPEHRIYPIFNFFKNWCQDESRHGDFFALVLKSQPQFLNDWQSRLWCRFFLLSVYGTMYLNDVAIRPDFYTLLGLEPRDYDWDVIRNTNYDASKVFPVVLDVENPKFVEGMDRCVANVNAIRDIGGKGGAFKSLRKLPYLLGTGVEFLKLFLLKPKQSIIAKELEAEKRAKQQAATA